MKRLKKIFTLIISIYLILLATNVSALSCDNLKDYSEIQMNVEKKEIVDDVIDGRLRSLNLPTSPLDLSKQSYRASIRSAASNWLYTNVYFKVDSNKKINVHYTLNSNNGQNAKIGVYDMTSSSWVKIEYGLAGTLTASDLNLSHKYAVGFAGNGSNIINGSAIISN